MKLLYTNSHPSDVLSDERAGHLVRARRLIDGLSDLGHDVVVIEAAAGRGAQAAATAYRSRLGWLPRRVQLILRDLARLLQSAIHGWKVARRAQSAGAEAIIETHNTGSVAGWVAAKRSRRPLILDDVTPASEDAQFYELGLPRLARIIRRRVVRAADEVVTVSSTIRSALIAEGIDPQRVSIVPNGTIEPPRPGARADWRDRLKLGIEDRAVIYVGSFQRFHAVPLAIRALAHPNCPPTAQAVLVGAGETFDDCVSLAAALQVSDRVHFVGHISHNDVAGLLAAADAAVLPGTADYMNPMKLYEYAAARLPTAVPDQPSVREAIGDRGGFAYFVPGDEASCAAALADVLGLAVERPHALDGERWADRAAALGDVIVRRVADRGGR